MIVAGRSAASDISAEQSLDDALRRGFDKVNDCAEILVIGGGTNIFRRTLTVGVFLFAQAERLSLR